MSAQSVIWVIQPEAEIGFGAWRDMISVSGIFDGDAIQGKSLHVGGFTDQETLASSSSCFFAQPSSTTSPTPTGDPPFPPVWPYQIGNIYQREHWSMDIVMIRIRTKVIDFVAYNGDGTVMDLTGATVRLTVKWSNFDADSVAVIKLDNAGLGGITISDPTNGVGQIVIPKTATSALPLHRSDLVYDVTVKKADTTEHTIAKGAFIVLSNVTETV